MKKYSLLIFTFFLLLALTIPFNRARAHDNPSFTLIYVVQTGDTLYEIADDYEVSVEYLKRKNNLKGENMIKAGQELIITSSASAGKDKSENAEKSGQKAEWNYNFQEQEKDSPHPRSIELNVGTNYSVRYDPRQSLPEVNIPSSQIITYHIGVGDTLFDLARSFNTSIGVLMALNNMENSTLHVGDKIKLPINNLSRRQVLARTVSSRELELLARAIHGEARGEPFIGQVAVGAVIINRVLSSYFPDTFKSVIYQPGQFSAVDDGQINLSPNRTSYKAARVALNGKDPTMGSIYYYNPRTATKRQWFQKHKPTVTIGEHVFAK